ncbi:peptide chain release factor family protein [Aspergillus clavatus NRRL 1]|uniref:Peptidyl-tRNA hydrolase domain protein n=1 Tax=Aspergillus clavatus (strain ATCC 1007 / CBS 513.65 / DSM 816 / NCTC 3887 / NRRL 1 / QM 1276 / 107) TaxID=344612 RepID=A1CMB5_ASPCL|nr:peptidyl-tRNA hydrolase domain protein [Aspergillus clavatus NRRL 1]EAW08702.1 peptidyl-tRNA hydrolase domain protein [Aspergillus clavatus NRRL 1]
MLQPTLVLIHHTLAHTRTPLTFPKLLRLFSLTPYLPEKQLPPRLKINDADLTISYLKGTGPGGQKINKTNSAVQLIHKPTGLVVKSQATRSRSQNEKIARQILADKVEELQKGDESRRAIKAERARKKKASKVKKSRRKYRELEREQGEDGERIEGGEGGGVDEVEGTVQKEGQARGTKPEGRGEELSADGTPHASLDQQRRS